MKVMFMKWTEDGRRKTEDGRRKTEDGRRKTEDFMKINLKFNYKLFSMKSIFEEDTYNEILTRIDSLTENSERQWGKMTAGQMAWHCQFPFAIGIKNKNKGNGNIFVRIFFKKQMYSDKPFRRNLPTARNLKPKEEKNLIKEKAILRQLVSEFYECRNRTAWNPHPIFGKFTHEQWGKMEYKHLDHHLTQFGV